MTGTIEPEETKPKETPAVEKKLSKLDEAKALAERIEAANLKTEELMKKQEEEKAIDLLSGKAEKPVAVPKPQLTAAEYYQNALEGKIDEPPKEG